MIGEFGLQAPPLLLGIHSSMPDGGLAEVSCALAIDGPAPGGLPMNSTLGTSSTSSLRRGL